MNAVIYNISDLVTFCLWWDVPCIWIYGNNWKPAAESAKSCKVSITFAKRGRDSYILSKHWSNEHGKMIILHPWPTYQDRSSPLILDFHWRVIILQPVNTYISKYSIWCMSTKLQQRWFIGYPDLRFNVTCVYILGVPFFDDQFSTIEDIFMTILYGVLVNVI